MEVWRLASSRYDPLRGEGTRRVGGRWNSPGNSMVYASESLSLCVVEALVHLSGPFPADYFAFRIDVPDSVLEVLDAPRLKSEWTQDLGYTRAIGDQWLDQGRSVALVVPSAVIPASANVLINPVHTESSGIRVLHSEAFRFDPRLR